MRTYQSTDASAPTLQGIVGGAYSGGWADGSLLELLRKILVVGYGSKTAAGWTLSYNGTSKGAFKQGAGCGFYLRVLDDGSLTAGAREAQFSGFETMSDVDTGTGEFPTNAQQSTRLKLRKSNTADTVVKDWLCFADNKTFVLYAWYNKGAGTDTLSCMVFGDFYSFHGGDLFNCVAWGRVTSATLDASTNEIVWRGCTGSTISTAQPGIYVARGYSQLGSSVNMGVWAFPFNNGTGAVSTSIGLTGNQISFPNNADSKILLSRLYLIDNATVPTSSLRGYLRGMWGQQCLATTFPKELPFDGVGTLAGRTFKRLGLDCGGVPCMETSDTWD